MQSTLSWNCCAHLFVGWDLLGRCFLFLLSVPTVRILTGIELLLSVSHLLLDVTGWHL